MLRPKDLETIMAQEVIFDIAKSLDPLAFDNNDMHDRERRRVLVYTRIELAYRDYQLRERGIGWIRPEIIDMEIEW